MLADARELSHLGRDQLLLRIDDLRRRHVLAGRRVDDDRVNLAELKRFDGLVEGRIDAWRFGGLDVIVDVRETRRADLVTVEVRLQFGGRVVFDDLVGLQCDD